MPIRRVATVTALLAGLMWIGVPASYAQNPATTPGDRQTWQTALHDRLPLLGHRNWILVVDSAYPLQTTPGLEVIETHMGLIPTLRETLAQIGDSRHVRANVFQDAELKDVPEADATGITAFRADVAAVLQQTKLASPPVFLPHLDLIARTNLAGRDFRILVLKSDETLPYTSVFLQLDCKYWSDDAEKRMRSLHNGAVSKHQ